MTTNATTTETAQENVFNGPSGLRVHATTVLASAFNDRMAHLVRNGDKRISEEVDDFIEAVDKLAQYLATGDRQADSGSA